MKPTTRLVVIVVVLSFLMALVVGGTAVGLHWTSAVDAQLGSLKEELDLVLNAAESFTVVQAKYREQQYQYSTTQMLSEVINKVGYETNLETVTRAQLNGVRIAGLMIDSLNQLWINRFTNAMVQNLGSTYNMLCTVQPNLYGNPTAIAPLLNLMNANQLNDTEELILIGLNKTTNNATIYTTLKFRNECPLESACTVSTSANTPAWKALKGQSDSFVGLDYSNTEVFGAYTYLPCLQVALIYQNRGYAVRENFLDTTIAAINTVNPKYKGTTEIIMMQVEKFGMSLSTHKLQNACPYGICGVDLSAGKATWAANSPNVTDPVAIDTDYRGGNQVLSVAYRLQSMNGTIVFEVDVAEIVSNMMPALKSASSTLNSELNGTVELLLGHQVTYVNGTRGVEYLTQRRFMKDCPAAGCGVDNAIYASTLNCEEGVGVSTDYRGKLVLAAYSCIDNLDVGCVLKVDVTEVVQRSINQLVDYSNAQNKDDSNSHELVVGQANANAPNGYVVLSDPKGDVSGFSVNAYPPMAAALKEKQKGFMRSEGFYGQRVVARYGYSPSLELAFVMKVDVSEMEKPSIIQLIIILFTAVGIALFGVTVVGVAANRLLAGIVETWEKSQRVVQEQKELFENLVSALYPKFASDRLLAGDSQIVLELPQVTCFFSDIVGFSTISNQLTAQELMTWIGYTFSVMDKAADYYAIYKIKTIGDAYFAIAGLPGLVAEGKVDNHSMRMAKFASTCAQIFSGHYAHPDAGSCLKMIAEASAVARHEQKSAMKKKAHRGSTSSKTSDSTGQTKGSKCMMRYGVASGPVTVGVLPGKCPAFDVWGKTVNLTSRMESNSRQGAVLCSEAVYKTIMAEPTNPFEFYDQVSTYAKGFGNVPTYFIGRTTEPPPKSLLADLQIEIAQEDYTFEIEGMTLEKDKSKMSVRKKPILSVGVSRPSGLPGSPSDPNGVPPTPPPIAPVQAGASQQNEVQIPILENDAGSATVEVIIPQQGENDTKIGKPATEAWN